MPPTFSRNAVFWRRCCVVSVSIAAIEAVSLVFIARTPPVPSPVVAEATRVMPATLDPVADAPTVPTEKAAPSRPRTSSRSDALATKGPRDHERALEDRGISLAEKDPTAAFRALAELAPGADRRAMTRGIFEVLARGDAARAIAYAKQTLPGLEREAALTTLLEGWNGPANDSLPLARARRIASANLETGLGLELLQGDSPRPDLAALWAQELSWGKGKTELLGAAAAIQAKTDPQLAASYGTGLVGKDQLAFNKDLVSSWAQVQPDAAWAWSSALDDPAARAQAQNAAIQAQSRTDPQGAIARLAWLPNDDQQRDETLWEVAFCYASANADAAIAWAQTLPPADRSAANAGISSVAPVGIGMTMVRDDDGYSSVIDLIPNAGAAQSGAIHPGDRILGVSQGNYQFVDAHNLDLENVVNLIRGTAGSLVQLQVAPALPDGGYGAPTVVSIVRQQVKPHG